MFDFIKETTFYSLLNLLPPSGPFLVVINK